MKLRDHQRVSMEVAKKRALTSLQRWHPVPASHVAQTIWPGHEMTGQGAGAAASRILVALRKEGKVIWGMDIHRLRWGWMLS